MGGLISTLKKLQHKRLSLLMHGNITIHLPGTRVHLIFSSYSRAEFIESASAPHFFTLLLSFALPLPLSPNLVKWRKGDWLTEWHEQGVSEIFFMFLNVKNFLAVNYTGLDFKACTWLRVFLPIFPKIAVRQTVGDCGAAEGNSKPCKPFSPTQYTILTLCRVCYFNCSCCC